MGGIVPRVRVERGEAGVENPEEGNLAKTARTAKLRGPGLEWHGEGEARSTSRSRGQMSRVAHQALS